MLKVAILFLVPYVACASYLSIKLVEKPIRIDTMKAETANAQEITEPPSTPPSAPEAPKQPTIDELIRKYFGNEYGLAKAVFTAESGLRPDAVGDTNTKYHSCGIAQIRILPTRGITCEQMKNPEHNIEYAKYLRDKSGWQNWSAYKNKSYKRFME